MDFFPTILASIGVSIEGDRLGLGTNLFSERKTLLEEYGYNYLYQELRKKSNFYNQELLYPK
jgi:phosphoglycerol transferase